MSKLFSDGISQEERVTRLEQYLENLAIHKDSRRGPEGAVGPKGDIGDTGATGATGPAGKDADISQAIKAAKTAIEDEFGFYLNAGSLRELINHQLIVAGFLDINGHPIHKAGPAGKDSTVPGPRGETGPAGRNGRDGVDGKDGKDGRHGERGPAGPQGEKGERGEPSNVLGPQGPQGEIGPEGLRGLPGVGLSKADVIQLIRDMKTRGSI
jgi:hypothetical protein